MPDMDSIGERHSAMTTEVQADRVQLAEARAAYEGQRREADNRSRRLAMIGLERRNWASRAENAAQQIAALNDRRSETADEAEARRRHLKRSKAAAALCLMSFRELMSVASRLPTFLLKQRLHRQSSTRPQRLPFSSLRPAANSVRVRKSA